MQTLCASTPNKQQLHQELKQHSDESDNAHWLAQIIASWQVGDSALPDALGLSTEHFQALLTRYFPGYYLAGFAASGIGIDVNRLQEIQDLTQLLKQFAADENVEIDWLITIIVTACLGEDHLWQDLGLWSRTELTALLKLNFPELVALNCHDMKWKKFLYKQLCDAEGIYVCRAPSCEFCQDYLGCYGDED